MTDFVPFIFEISLLKSMTMSSLPSSQDMGRSCPLTTVISMTLRHCVMETGWSRFCLIRIFLALFVWKAASVVFGTLVNHLSALFVASLVTVPQPARFLVSAGAVASPFMWPRSVRRLGAPLFLFLVLLLMALLMNMILLRNNRLPAVYCSFCSCFCTVYS